ncbi:MAG: hypothetical protein WBG82_01185 [Parvibaculum sp.]|uniref:hypothetical protein n=1 Tax=Parvibaculum sp. TaxID=2024848 RepID=UPI003C710752
MTSKFASWGAILSLLAAVLFGVGMHAVPFSDGHSKMLSEMAPAGAACDGCSRHEGTVPASSSCQISCGVPAVIPMAAIALDLAGTDEFEVAPPAAMRPWTHAPELSPPRLSA